MLCAWFFNCRRRWKNKNLEYGRHPDSVCLEEYIQDEIRPFRDADAIEG